VTADSLEKESRAMFKPVAVLIACLRQIAESRRGNVSMIFGLAAIPIFIAAGIAVDVTRAYTAKERLGAALDAAALAVGSELNKTQAQLTTELNNYFQANYPAALGPATISTVPANASLTAAVVTFQAQANVPTTFMRVAGFTSIPISVTNQIKRTQGLEVALVLDNTGSMLCGQNDGAPNYQDSLCAQGVVQTDTTCTNPNNGARICALRNAATEFVNTLFSAITTPNQLYISVVPYVTTVNVGPALCGSGCGSNIATSGGKFIDQYGNVINDANNRPITYDSTQNLTSAEWLGCVIEPTSADEMTSGSTALKSAVLDPDMTEPSGGWPAWYPFYWKSGSGNSWTPSTIKNPLTASKLGQVVAGFDQSPGPNQGCPVPLLPLSTDQQTILNTINSMWPRDSGGTQVNTGMIWGWRTISPVGPFAPNNGHPMTYSDATNQGWLKVVVLETDGTEEWVNSSDLTGLGFISDGKIGTTSTSTAMNTNLGNRLKAICQNMANQHIIIYTIGLGSDGQSNTVLKNNCPANGGYFIAASDTASLQTAFNTIAQSLLALRLSQ
jgi:Flp pilus assembly protein TadG